MGRISCWQACSITRSTRTLRSQRKRWAARGTGSVPGNAERPSSSAHTMKKSALALTCLLALAALPSAVAAPKTNEFFAFCIDTHDAKKRNLEQQAQLLKELGYDGVGHLWLDNIPERLKTLDAAGLKMFQITMTVDITPGKQAYDPKFKEIMPLLKGRGVQFVLLMSGPKPSDPAGDPRAVEIIREMASVAVDSG